MTPKAFKKLLEDDRIFFREYAYNKSGTTFGGYYTNLQWLAFVQKEKFDAEKYQETWRKLHVIKIRHVGTVKDLK